VRRGARWALGVGAALITMAAVSSARADVVAIDLARCSASCMAAGIEDSAADEDDSAGDDAVSLSRSGAAEGANARPDLVFDPKALPPLLVDGLPSPIAVVGAQTIESPGVSPYAFFETIIDVPHSADAPALTAVRLTRSLTSRLSNFLWASNDFFGPPSGDVASRRGLPISVDLDAMTGRLSAGWKVRAPVTSTLSPSPLSGPPSSGAAQPLKPVGNDAGPSAQFSSDGAGSSK
jgi:hypothetical protein